MPYENIEVVLGTYEEFILGYKIVSDEKESYSLVQSFANHSHRASIRCVATAGKYLASGGADEDIHLYDLSSRKESGILGYHDGTVNCLQFTPNGSHLLSGCEKGTIAVCRTGNWQVEKQWGAAHKGSAVTSLSVHPSGKIALSVGRDGRLRTWNLIKGRQAYATHLSVDKYQQVSSVEWSSSGDMYAVLFPSRVDVYNMETAGVIYSFESKKKLTCIFFMNDDILCVGDEEGSLALHSVQRRSLLKKIKAHEDRIKCMDMVNPWLVSASSSGTIRLWSLKNEEHLSEVCSVNTGCRITCIVLVCGQNTNSTTKEEELDVKAQVLSKSDKRKVGFVVELSDSESSPMKKGTVIMEQTSPKSKINKKDKSRKLKSINKTSAKKNKLKKQQLNSSTVSVTDSCGQKWVVEDIE
ncbi:p21-activated protein kinase-interacting protein 1-like [Anabrus simplex]|uniref:p21-activated protein kinase-interacting protein 1-like n=1 Tax=Anabrus simplex TaxID=316456 RepID=UPI0035A2A9C9